MTSPITALHTLLTERARIAADIDTHATTAVRLGAATADLRAAGLTQHEANNYVATVDPEPGPHELPLVPTNSNDSVVAIIPTDRQIGGPLWHRHHVYLRAHSKRQPVRLDATFAGTDTHQVIDDVREIVARFRIPHAGIPAPVHHDPQITARLAAVWQDPVVSAGTWPGPTDVFVLGAPAAIHLPLGYSGGVRSVGHHRLGDLRAAQQYKGLPRI